MNFFKKIPVCLANLLFPIKIYGKENIPKDGAVCVCNHFSFIDSVYIRALFNDDVYFLGKKEVFENKFAGWILKCYGGIPIDRENPDIKSLFTATKVVKDGYKLVIFPEGTRNKTGTNELQQIKGGSAVFAVKAKRPIVPMMILQKARLFRRNALIIGQPFYLEDYYSKKLTPEVVDEMDEFVRQKMIEQQKILFELTAKKKK